MLDSPDGARVAMAPPAPLFVIPSPRDPLPRMKWNPPVRQFIVTMNGSMPSFVKAWASWVVKNEMFAPQLSKPPCPMYDRTDAPPCPVDDGAAAPPGIGLRGVFWRRAAWGEFRGERAK